MSSFGNARLVLEQARREQLRLEQIRFQVRNIVAACEAQILALRNPVVQQLAAAGIASVRNKLADVKAFVSDRADGALQESRAAARSLSRAIAQAQASAQRWTRRQTEASARLAETRGQLEAVKNTTNTGSEAIVAEAAKTLAEAEALYEAGKHAEATTLCDKIDALTVQATKATLDETVRRTVVGDVLSTLQEMGFVVEPPQLRDPNNNGGVVTLTGRLPSGKLARFDVHVDGRMRFEFDGYEGRSCGAQLQQMEETLRQRCGVKLSVPQVTWKNPDRLSKGARDLPSDASRGGSK